MTEKIFMIKLNQNLFGLSTVDKNEIIFDYKEHFRQGKSNGKKEEDICDTLGDPKQIGKNSRLELLVDNAHNKLDASNIFKAVVASLSLGFFNIVFVLGPYLGLVGIMIGLWATCVSLMISGLFTSIAILLYPLIKLFVPYMNSPESPVLKIAAFIGGIALFSLAALGTLGMVKLTNLFYRGTVKYLQSNIRIIKRED